MNAFEAAARAAKVAKILAVVPVGETRRELDIVVSWLEAMTVQERRALALHAGCTAAPSDVTWAAVVEGARVRKTAAEVFGRAGRAAS
jgi:hypothetical protein